MVKTYRRFDAAEYLESEEDIAGFLAESTASGEPAVMLSALSAIARARNMSELAKNAEMTREGLYKALAATGNPSFANVARIARAMGFQFALVPAQSPHSGRSARRVAPSPVKNAGIAPKAIGSERTPAKKRAPRRVTVAA